MRSTLFIILTLYGIAVFQVGCTKNLSTGTVTTIALTADKSASVRAQALYSYMSTLATNHKILSGQFINNAVYYATDYTTVFTPLVLSTGKTPAFMGADYDLANVVSTTLPSLTGVNTMLKGHVTNGGLVMILWTTRNPWTGGATGAGDRTVMGPLSDLYTPGNAAYTQFQLQMDHLAAGLADLQTSGALVLFRPFHEMNGNWFWWGNRTISEYAALWQYLFNYLTVTKGIHNLVWAYTPGAKTGGAMSTVDAYYPGDNYVDVVGVDIYTNSFTITDYVKLQGLKKPMLLAEVGPQLPATTNTYDYSTTLAILKSTYPDVMYFMVWNGTGALINQLNPGPTLSDSAVVNMNLLPIF